MTGDTLALGQPVHRSGFVTQALYLRGQEAHELERRLGYRSGRLAAGWWLLFLTKMPAPHEFEIAGYSHLSGGVAQGHLARPPDPRTMESRARDEGLDLARVKKGLIRDTFSVLGERPQRLAKVLPVAGEFGGADYPPGSGIPQWKLTKKLPFVVAAFVGPGQVYAGTYQDP
jgi:hypothetical protein